MSFSGPFIQTLGAAAADAGDMPLLVALVAALVLALILLAAYAGVQRGKIRSLEGNAKDQRRRQALLANSRDAFHVFDMATKRLLWVSDSIINQTGYTAEEMVAQGTDLFRLTPEADRMVNEAVEKLETNPDSFESPVLVLQHTHRDGRLLDVEVSILPVRDERGRIVELCGISRDITRRMNLHRELVAKVAHLEEAALHINRLQGILPICMQCHKIRTDQESWQRIDHYLCEHSDAKLSHGICPECLKIHYSEVLNLKPGDNPAPNG